MRMDGYLNRIVLTKPSIFSTMTRLDGARTMARVNGARNWGRMNWGQIATLILILGQTALLGPTCHALANDQVAFDLAAVIAAEPVAQAIEGSTNAAVPTLQEDSDLQEGGSLQQQALSSQQESLAHESPSTTQKTNETRLWRIPIELSTLVPSPTTPRIQQILLEIDLLDPQITIADYQPRTHTSSDFVGNVAVEQCEEKSGRVGLNLRSSYPPVVAGDFASDISQKHGETRKYLRVAPVEIVAASGTTKRRQGVFFKLRATTTQVLEGDKAFEVVIQTPALWNRGLLRVQVRAEGLVRHLPGFPTEEVTLGQRLFVVALHAADDQHAFQQANRLAGSIRKLERLAIDHEREIQRRATPTVFHQMASKLDLAPPKIQTAWLQKALLQPVDVANDRQMSRLPVDVRVAILDYQQARKDFANMANPTVSSLIGTRLSSEFNSH